jgi:hypothetical protein
MAKPTVFDWIKYYAKYGMLFSLVLYLVMRPILNHSSRLAAHIKVKRGSLYALVIIALPFTCGMSMMWTDNYPWWDLPKRPDEVVQGSA